MALTDRRAISSARHRVLSTRSCGVALVLMGSIIALGGPAVADDRGDCHHPPPTTVPTTTPVGNVAVQIPRDLVYHVPEGSLDALHLEGLANLATLLQEREVSEVVVTTVSSPTCADRRDVDAVASILRNDLRQRGARTVIVTEERSGEWAGDATILVG